METTYNPNANYFTSGATFNTAPPQVPNAITSESLTPSTPINLAQAPQDNTNYSATLQGVGDYQSIVDGLYAPSEEESAVKGSTNKISSLMNSIMGRGGSVNAGGEINSDMAKNQANERFIQQFGYTGSADAAKQLREVTNNINSLKKEALAIPLQLQNDVQGRGVTAGGLAPIQAGQLRTNTIKTLQMASIAETIQGNISTAADSAAKAVEMEFAPIQAQLNAEMFNYNMNKDTLARSDSKRAKTAEFKLAERQRILDNQKEDKKVILGWAAEAAKNGAPTLLLSRAQQSNNPQEVLSILGQYMSDPTEKAQALANLEQTREQTRIAIAQSVANIANTKANTARTLKETQLLGFPKPEEAAKLLEAEQAKVSAEEKKQEALTLATQLLDKNAVGKSSAVGASAAKLVPFGQSLGLQGKRSAFEARVDTLKSNLTLENLKLLKGAMSDKDLLFLNSIGSSLNTDMDETEFDAELQKVIDRLSGTMVVNGVTYKRGADGKYYAQ